MRPLPTGAADVPPASVVNPALDSQEMGLAIRSMAERVLADRLQQCERGVVLTSHEGDSRPSKELEGHHGRHRVAGQAEHRRRADEAERKRLRWLDRDLHPAHVGDLVEHDLHIIEGPHRHAPRRQDRIHSTAPAAKASRIVSG